MIIDKINNLIAKTYITRQFIPCFHEPLVTYLLAVAPEFYTKFITHNNNIYKTKFQPI